MLEPIIKATLENVLPLALSAQLNDRVIGRLAGLAGAVPGNGGSEGLAETLPKALKLLSEEHGFAEWMIHVFDRLADVPFQRFWQNFLIGMVLEGHRARVQALEAGYELPLNLVINPTMRCNLKCTGCYAWNFEKAADMPYAVLAKALGEARELGIRFITLTGGEPPLYKDFYRMFEEFSDLNFMMYTNGTLIDEAMARRFAELGNVWPAVSLEGFAEDTDARRGRGVHAKALAAFERLREHGVFYGFSVTPTRHNSDIVASDEHFQMLQDQGCLFGWYFTYIPVGRDPEVDLMCTPEQRDTLRRSILRWREEAPLLLGDFWNDGACVGGCLSASRYCYISVDGDVQPCTFVHFATHNIRDHTLKEIFQSPLFTRIREAQPYHTNLLRPCKIIDHPDVLRTIVTETGAHGTCEGATRLLEDNELRAFLDDYAKRWAEISEKAWKEDYDEGRNVRIPFFGRVNVWDVYAFRLNRARQLLEETAKVSS
jgi:MoaA/NifB/PqqE/SkfB family radical SAM enzyme